MENHYVYIQTKSKNIYRVNALLRHESSTKRKSTIRYFYPTEIYTEDEFVDAIKKADAECDILVAYVHWGTEYTTVLDEQQKTLAREYIDAGVDAYINTAVNGMGERAGNADLVSCLLSILKSAGFRGKYKLDENIVSIVITSNSGENKINQIIENFE